MTAVLTATMALAMSINALAYVPVVGWKSEQLGDSTHWHYDKTGYGNFAVNEWLWIDGNGDGIAECYNFDSTSFMRANTVTPDGYTVNADGAWVIDGVVQTKQVGQETAQQPEPEQNNVQAVNLLDLSAVSGKLWKINNARTNKNELWSAGFKVFFNEYTSLSDSYVEFMSGGQYNTLTGTVALPNDIGEHARGCLEIYGDDDTLLYSSDEMNYKSDSISFTVDISGQNYIKFIGSGSGNGYTYHGSNSFPLLIKNAQFK